MIRQLFFALVCLWSVECFAARPMMTDDARLVDAKSCQTETWFRRNKDDSDIWSLPGCNPSGNLEITTGGALTRDETGTRPSTILLQGKTLFRTLLPNDWAFGLVLGGIRHPNQRDGGGMVDEFYGYVPASLSLMNDIVVLHGNAGYGREKLPRDPANPRQHFTWGLGSETQMHERLYFIAETFGQTPSRPLFQAGFRFWVVPNRFQIDTTYGNRFDGGITERWFSIGIRLLSPPFVP